MKLILASGSPRRRELLGFYTKEFDVCVSEFDEHAVRAPTPAALAGALARGKCLAVAASHPGCVVVGSDTVVELDGEVFGKPQDADDARRMLRALSGRTHEVHTGVCVSDGARTESFVDTCKVTFSPSRRRSWNAASPAASPSTRPGPTPSRAARPSGWTGWKGTITPSWGCRSAAPPGCWTASTLRKDEKTEKIVKALVKRALCDYNNGRTGLRPAGGGRPVKEISQRGTPLFDAWITAGRAGPPACAVWLEATGE